MNENHPNLSCAEAQLLIDGLRAEIVMLKNPDGWNDCHYPHCTNPKVHGLLWCEHHQPPDSDSTLRK